jgi:anti-sigma B factor antagonist
MIRCRPEPALALIRAGVLAMSPPKHSHLHVRTVDGIEVVSLVDSEILFEEAVVRALGAELTDLVAHDGCTKLLVNLEGVRYISSSMLATLVALERKVRQKGGKLRLCGLGPTVRDVFSTSHLDRLFEIDEDEPSGLARLKEPIG